MAAPRVLLIDDSEAVLAYERAALSGHYAVNVASDGVAGLDAIRALSPSVVVLDLSMPRMDGDEVLETMLADPDLRKIPVVVVSSEESRGRACLRAGAAAFLPKPMSAAELLAAVNRAYDGASAARAGEDTSVLLLEAGGMELGIPVASVRSVLMQVAIRGSQLELHGRTVSVVDLPALLGTEHSQPLLDRKLVVLDHGGATLALCVDDVRGPEAVDAKGGEASVVQPEAIFALSEGAPGAALVEGLRQVGRARPPASGNASDPPESAAVLELRSLRARSPLPLAEEHEPTWVALVSVGSTAFALPLTSLLGVVPLSGVVSVPLAPPHVFGVLRFRGDLIAAVSSSWLAGRLAEERGQVLLVAQSAAGRRVAIDSARVPEPVALRDGGPRHALLDLDAALART